MAREPIIEAFGEDLCRLLAGDAVEREMLLDWYDSHTYRPYLENTKTKLNMINTFYPAGCTDCLAAPDGGLIKIIQDGFKRAVNARLAENYDEIYASDFDSKRKQRKLIMEEMQKQITLLSQETVVKIASTTGSVFKLHDSLEEQFKNIKLRGYLEHKEDSQISKKPEYRNLLEGFVQKKVERKDWHGLRGRKKGSNSGRFVC